METILLFLLFPLFLLSPFLRRLHLSTAPPMKKTNEIVVIVVSVAMVSALLC